MTLMEIRAKARRLKQRHDLKLIVVDYLQLMTSPKRVESRQQEVAELSRGLKLLAKEVECPVIAVSQLNRGPEQRTDKRPQLSDLRESGCLTADTRVIRADTNAEVTLGELLASGARDIPVWALDERLMYTPRTMTHVFPSGRKEVFRLRLASGKEIEATANHPFLTFDGWRPLGDLARRKPDRRAAARPARRRHHAVADDEVVMLAHLLGDGSFVRRQPIRYASRDEANLAAVAEAAKHFGITADPRRVRRRPGSPRCGCRRRTAWPAGGATRSPSGSTGSGLFGLRSHEKFVPDAGLRAAEGADRRFPAAPVGHRRLGDHRRGGRGGRVYYASTSRRLLEDVSRLLLRFGITARLHTVTPRGSPSPVHTRHLGPRRPAPVPARDRRARRARPSAVRELLAVLEGDAEQPQRRHDAARGLDQGPKAILVEQGMSHRRVRRRPSARSSAAARCGSTRRAGSGSRGSLRCWTAPTSTCTRPTTCSGTRSSSIESIGEQDVYDATVLGTHNFIANGIATHNSIEQDADVVILLHRDDYYDKESPRAGEADFIVAKHRNGPTDTVTVAAQLHLSRFVDMAI